MKTETKGKRNGIQWKILTQLDDLDFADDLALMSHSHRQMQVKTTNLARISAQVGLKINKKKTKILRLNTTCERPIMLEGEGLEEVESFRYLGSIVDTRGGTEADVKTRISKARAAFHILRNVWKSRVIDKTTKIRLFNTNVKSVLLYGAETWRMNKTTLKRIQTFVNQCLRKILGIKWMDKVSNKDLCMGEDKPSSNRARNSQEKMGMAGPHIEKAKHQRYETGLDVEPPGQAKEGETKKTPGGVTLRQTSRKRD